MFSGSVLSFVKFGYQSTKNVHEFREVCLRMYLCVLLCLDEFYGFVSLETKVECS